MLPDNREFARIREDLNASVLPDTCELITITRAPDGMGGFTETLGTAGTVDCRLDKQMVFSTEQVRAGVRVPSQRYYLSLPHGTTVTEQYRAKVNGMMYAIISVPAGSWQGFLKCEVERI